MRRRASSKPEGGDFRAGCGNRVAARRGRAEVLEQSSESVSGVLAQAVCYSKGDRWAYEEEWRAITWRREEGGKEYGDYAFYPGELELICFGVRCDRSSLEKLVRMSVDRYPHARLERMIVEEGKLRRVALPQ
jgi:hypothetical protein